MILVVLLCARFSWAQLNFHLNERFLFWLFVKWILWITETSNGGKSLVNVFFFSLKFEFFIEYYLWICLPHKFHYEIIFSKFSIRYSIQVFFHYMKFHNLNDTYNGKLTYFNWFHENVIMIESLYERVFKICCSRQKSPTSKNTICEHYFFRNKRGMYYENKNRSLIFLNSWIFHFYYHGLIRNEYVLIFWILSNLYII